MVVCELDMHVVNDLWQCLMGQLHIILHVLCTCDVRYLLCEFRVLEGTYSITMWML